MLTWVGNIWHLSPARRWYPQMVDRHGQERIGLDRSPEYHEAEADMVRAFASQWDREPWEGPALVTIGVWLPRVRRQGPAEGLAQGSVVMPVQAVLDALEGAQVVTVDQVCALVVSKDHGPGGVRVRVDPWPRE